MLSCVHQHLNACPHARSSPYRNLSPWPVSLCSGDLGIRDEGTSPYACHGVNTVTWNSHLPWCQVARYAFPASYGFHCVRLRDSVIYQHWRPEEHALCLSLTTSAAAALLVFLAWTLIFATPSAAAVFVCGLIFSESAMYLSWLSIHETVGR
jgi:hypothetical protein